MPALVLEIVEGLGAGQQLSVDGPVEIGRDPDGGLTLADEQVSRHHARLAPEGAGAVVEDLGSTNGTYVNEQRIAGRRVLAAGDRLRLGTTVMELRSATQVASQPSAVVPMPQITAADDVLQRVPESELSGVFEAPAMPAMRRPETPAAYVPEGITREDAAAEPSAGAARAKGEGQDYGALRGMVDSRVKQQTSIAAFAFLAVAALAVAIYFGAT